MEDVSLVNINHPEQLVQLSIINFLSEVIENVQVFVENGRYQWGLVLVISLITVCPSENNIFQNKIKIKNTFLLFQKCLDNREVIVFRRNEESCLSKTIFLVNYLRS